MNVASKDRIGREPLRQLPVKWSSDMVCTGHVCQLSCIRPAAVNAQFCRCILTVGPLGALLIHI